MAKKNFSANEKNQSYSVQEKLNAIELYLTKELSYKELANQLGINNFSLIANWVRTYRMFDIDGLSKQKGRPSKMTKKKKTTKNESTELEKLEKENRMLKIENAYLKELRRLRLEDERKMSEQRESSTVSEKTFD